MSLLFTVLMMSPLACQTEAQILPADTSKVSGNKAVVLKPKQTEEIPSKSPTGALIRSAVFPGWGQFYTKHYIKGGLILCLESGLIVSALIEDKKAQDVYLTGYEEYLERMDRRNGYIWWTVGVVAYSMLDAYVDAHLFNFDEDDVSISIEPSPDTGGVRFSLRVPIPEFR